LRESRRQKKVASLIQDALSFPVAEIIPDSTSNLVTITRVEMSPDLRSAHVYLSVLDQEQGPHILDLLEKKKGILRKAVASKTILKYNPTLFFSLDPFSAYEENIDKILKRIKNESPPN